MKQRLATFLIYRVDGVDGRFIYLNIKMSNETRFTLPVCDVMTKRQRTRDDGWTGVKHSKRFTVICTARKRVSLQNEMLTEMPEG